MPPLASTLGLDMLEGSKVSKESKENKERGVHSVAETRSDNGERGGHGSPRRPSQDHSSWFAFVMGMDAQDPTLVVLYLSSNCLFWSHALATATRKHTGQHEHRAVRLYPAAPFDSCCRQLIDRKTRQVSTNTPTQAVPAVDACERLAELSPRPEQDAEILKCAVLQSRPADETLSPVPGDRRPVVEPICHHRPPPAPS